MELQTKIYNTLSQNLSVGSQILIECPKMDDSHLVITIKSPDFNNLSRIDQNKLIYSYLSESLNSGELHAVTLKLTPQ